MSGIKTPIATPLVFFALTLSQSAHAQVVRYVDQSATGPAHDGSSWCSAFTDLQDALDVAVVGDEIRVAEGTYKPDRGTGDRAASFVLKDDVVIVGGYAGCGAADPDDRDITIHETTLSGDLAGDDAPDFAGYEENSYHVVYGVLAHATAVLDGFTIRGGNANDNVGRYHNGGGLYAWEGRPVLRNCRFVENRADTTGGAATTDEAEFTDCTFEGNTAGFAGGAIAGNPGLTHCLFTGNRKTGLPGGGGGAVFLTGPTRPIDRCVFLNNEASGDADGGAVYTTGGAAFFSCMFMGNQTTGGIGDGAGAYVEVGYTTTFTNCTFAANHATGTAGGIFSVVTYPVLRNCVLWYNTAEILLTLEEQQIAAGYEGGFVVEYSLVEGWTGSWGGPGNSGADPLFVNMPTGDLHLSPGSPAIDAGTNALAISPSNVDLDGRPRFLDDPASPDMGAGTPPIVDRGAYEFSDCNMNGVTDEDDIAAGTSDDCNANVVPDECEPDTDCNGNGAADICDLYDSTSSDCNENGVPDECDIASGASADCTGNGIPDDCETDCDNNGVADICEVLDGTIEDCNDNTVPDSCDVASMDSPDCNGNGVPDECDVGDTNSDCNGNDVPDECETDCQPNGIPDDCDIADGTSVDCNATGVPDECEDDCNGNGLADECDIADGISRDCDNGGVPDECQSVEDCNGNGVSDACDLLDGTSFDCNATAIPDECEVDCNGNGLADECDIADATSQDCDDNGAPDECQPDEDCNNNATQDFCDVANGTSGDCNANLIPDECDIASGASFDEDQDEVPDECQFALSPCSNDFAEAYRGAGGERLSRFGCIAAANPVPSGHTALRVVFKTLYNTTPGDPDGASLCVPRSMLLSPPPSISQFEGQTRWLGAPVEIADEAKNNPPNYIGAPLVCTADEAGIRDWTQAGLESTFGEDADVTRIYFYGRAVVPCSVYEVSQCAAPFDQQSCADPVLVLTGRVGDVWPPLNVIGQPSKTDINAIVDKFREIPFTPGRTPLGGPPEWHGLLWGNVVANYDETVVNRKVGFLDLSIVVDGFKGLPYKEQGPCDPKTATDECGQPCSIDP